MSPTKPTQDQPHTRLARRVKTAQQVSGAAMIPTMLLVGLVGGYFLGAWLEGHWGGKPWLSFGGLVLGGVASVRKVIQLVRAESRGPDQ